MTAPAIDTRPVNSRGVPIGDGAWLLVVEAWNDSAWINLTPDIRGLRWTRGTADVDSNPPTGTATITLDNSSRAWTPARQLVAATIACPGTFVRICMMESTDATNWRPQFSGRVESWNETRVGFGIDRFVTVTLAETTSWLAGMDFPVGVAPFDAGTVVANRLVTLIVLNSAWPYGTAFGDAHVLSTTCQATDLSGNRLSECHLTAFSADLHFRSHKSGRAMVTEADARQNAVTKTSWPTPSTEGRHALIDFPNGIMLHPNGDNIPANPYVLLSSTRWLSAPDEAALDFTTADFSVVVEVALDDYTLGTDQMLAAKRDNTTNFSWGFYIRSDGFLGFQWSTGGTPATAVNIASTVIAPLKDKERAFIGAVYEWVDANNANIAFWVGTLDHGVGGAGLLEDDNWLGEQVGTTRAHAGAGTTTIFSGTAPLTFGRTADGLLPATGKIYSAWIGGTFTVVPNGAGTFKFSNLNLPNSPTATTFIAATGQTVTINGTGARVSPSTVLVYDADSLVETNDDEVFAGTVALTRVGGTEQVAGIHQSVLDKLGPRRLARSGLINQNDTDVNTLARRIKRRTTAVIWRPVRASFFHRPGMAKVLAALDLGDLVYVTADEGDLPLSARVTQLTHNITPAVDSVVWTVEVGLAAYATP